MTIEQETEKKKKKNKNEFELPEGVKASVQPTRQVPSLLEGLVERNIPVMLAKNGYYIGGFYGLGSGDKQGFAFVQETNDTNILVVYDSKNNACAVSSFEDLVRFNSHVWASFFKVSELYKKPDSLWFGYMLELNALNITPK